MMIYICLLFFIFFLFCCCLNNRVGYDFGGFGFSDGKLEIVVPSFVHYLEVLDGSDGDKTPGIERRFYSSLEPYFELQI